MSEIDRITQNIRTVVDNIRPAAPPPGVEQMIEEILRDTGQVVEIDMVDNGTYAARVGGGWPEVYAGSVHAAWRERRNDG